MDIMGARTKVDAAIEMYVNCAVLLSNELILQNRKIERRNAALKWIWEGKFESEEKHRLLTEKYIPGCGQWFLESEDFKDWVRFGEDSSMLICSGFGK